MKTINKLKKLFLKKQDNLNEEVKSKNNGDLILLIWHIEKLRKRVNGNTDITMNELLASINKRFIGTENIKLIEK